MGLTKPKRAGVIPYTIRDSKLYFLLGVDRASRDLTDFGGGVKGTESAIDTAFRELMEETCELFGNTINKDELLNSPVITTRSGKMAIFFLYVDPNWLYHAEPIFRACQSRLYKIKKYNEMLGIKWVVDIDFKIIAFNRYNQSMWKRVQNILSFNTNWNELRIRLFCGHELCSTNVEQWHLVVPRSRLCKSN
jgi:hypothetical protein